MKKTDKPETPSENNLEFEQFTKAVKHLVSVSKEELEAKRIAYEKRKLNDKNHTKQPDSVTT